MTWVKCASSARCGSSGAAPAPAQTLPGSSKGRPRSATTIASAPAVPRLSAINPSAVYSATRPSPTSRVISPRSPRMKSRTIAECSRVPSGHLAGRDRGGQTRHVPPVQLARGLVHTGRGGHRRGLRPDLDEVHALLVDGPFDVDVVPVVLAHLPGQLDHLGELRRAGFQV